MVFVGVVFVAVAMWPVDLVGHCSRPVQLQTTEMVAFMPSKSLQGVRAVNRVTEAHLGVLAWGQELGASCEASVLNFVMVKFHWSFLPS